MHHLEFRVAIYNQRSADYMASPFHKSNGTSTISCSDEEAADTLLKKFRKYPDIVKVAIQVLAADNKWYDMRWWDCNTWKFIKSKLGRNHGS